MVLTRQELIESLQKEVRILLHLAGKIDRTWLDYRPSPKQRSIIELLRYLSIMGPQMVEGAKSGKFDPEKWKAAAEATERAGIDEIVAIIARQSDFYAEQIGSFSDAELRDEIDPFGGGRTSRGSFIVNLVLCGYAAYRTQLFLYLKSCGREELSTYNLWQGIDPPVVAA